MIYTVNEIDPRIKNIIMIQQVKQFDNLEICYDDIQCQEGGDQQVLKNELQLMQNINDVVLNWIERIVKNMQGLKIQNIFRQQQNNAELIWKLVQNLKNLKISKIFQKQQNIYPMHKSFFFQPEFSFILFILIAINLIIIYILFIQSLSTIMNYFNQFNYQPEQLTNQFQEDQELPVDNQNFQINQDENYNFQIAQKKFTTIGLITTKNTKTVTKGRPKKREVFLEYDQILSEHLQTVFGLVLYYTSNCLKKQYKKYSKCGFLHKNIAPSNNFYLEIRETIKKNKIISCEHKNTLLEVIQHNQFLYKFIQKLLWIGPTIIIDQIIYIVSVLLIKHPEIITKFESVEDDQGLDIDQIKQIGKKFATEQLETFWNKLIYIIFKSPRFRFSEQGTQNIKNNLIEFVEVLIVSTILSIYNIVDNPYFSKYYTYDQQNQDKKNKNKQKKRILFPQPVDTPQIPHPHMDNDLIDRPNYQILQNSIQYIKFYQNFHSNYMTTYGIYYNPYSAYYGPL